MPKTRLGADDAAGRPQRRPAGGDAPPPKKKIRSAQEMYDELKQQHGTVVSVDSLLDKLLRISELKPQHLERAPGCAGKLWCEYHGKLEPRHVRPQAQGRGLQFRAGSKPTILLRAFMPSV